MRRANPAEPVRHTRSSDHYGEPSAGEAAVPATGDSEEACVHLRLVSDSLTTGMLRTADISLVKLVQIRVPDVDNARTYLALAAPITDTHIASGPISQAPS